MLSARPRSTLPPSPAWPWAMFPAPAGLVSSAPAALTSPPPSPPALETGDSSVKPTPRTTPSASPAFGANVGREVSVPGASLPTAETASKKRKKDKSKKDLATDGQTQDRKRASAEKKRRKLNVREDEARAKKAAKQARRAAKEAIAANANSDIKLCLSSFDDVDFAESILTKLKGTFPAPTGIQSRAWPVALSGKDLIAVAKTGSGKTLAFLLPVISRISVGSDLSVTSGSICALCLAPTRELASQIATQCLDWAPLQHIQSNVVYGGTPIGQQISSLRKQKPELLVATPGRLVDLLGQRAVVLEKSCKIVVLDEADRMLDMGFEPQLKQIFAALPASRQTLLFSATWPKSVRKLATKYLRSTEETTTIFVDTAGSTGDDKTALEAAMGQAEPTANKSVCQEFVHATDDEKDNLLWSKLCELKEGSRVIVFANTKRRVDNLAKTFAEFGTCAIHGDKAQSDRERALADFVAERKPLMIATDVAARGLDIKGVTHVFNFDMARDVESYVHRIGRTGRAGASGVSITFWNPDYDKECAPALVKIAKNAGQHVPDWLAKFETTKASKLWSVSKAHEALAAAEMEA